MKIRNILILLLSFMTLSCAKPQELSIVVIAPGHFHASLLQKNSLENVSNNVRVYAPSGSELESYKAMIESYNNREENPTSWVLDIYEGEDYLEQLPNSDGKSFVVLAGNNKLKSTYILEAVSKGYHVLSDKPMAINVENYEQLERAYELAKGKGLIIYDMMTERYDIKNIIVRSIMLSPEVFGEVAGKMEIDDIHYFSKQVSGNQLIRPMWYFDVRQQGEGIADVTTHFIDLVFWECFPEQSISIADIQINSAERYPTLITLAEYKAVTGASDFPEYLEDDLVDGVLHVYSNGKIDFRVKNIEASIAMRWDYIAEEGGRDQFSQKIPGTISTLEIIQDESTNYKRNLYVLASSEISEKIQDLLRQTWPNMSLLEVSEDRYFVEIPSEYIAHEEHFNLLGRTFIDCILSGNIPAWEKTNTLTKYYLTTKAVELASTEHNSNED